MSAATYALSALSVLSHTPRTCHILQTPSAPKIPTNCGPATTPLASNPVVQLVSAVHLFAATASRAVVVII